ncbi:MAG: hypothetical protein AVDCRST_MAG71-2346 [uncultured Lysobacter sp.]|uniref:Uncharacterized protein n=1 Tax=uncultured Lysobacter sp. TaxID=271060 RepID=A0A6J4LW14_9GAMM|nr:MAG: hypothetical protein AVDCRST_MAG71-2346 [uncultured Lysobacter sp.]
MAGLEAAFAPMLVALTAPDRRRIVKMGEGSEVFCRRAYMVMRDNEALLSRSIDLDEMERDLATHDALAKRRVRLDRLIEKMTDTDIAAGSDAMATALAGYAFLKVTGTAEGLHGLRRGLGKRFAITRIRDGAEAEAENDAA